MGSYNRQSFNSHFQKHAAAAAERVSVTPNQSARDHASSSSDLELSSDDLKPRRRRKRSLCSARSSKASHCDSRGNVSSLFRRMSQEMRAIAFFPMTAPASHRHHTHDSHKGSIRSIVGPWPKPAVSLVNETVKTLISLRIVNWHPTELLIPQPHPTQPHRPEGYRCKKCSWFSSTTYDVGMMHLAEYHAKAGAQVICSGMMAQLLYGDAQSDYELRPNVPLACLAHELVNYCLWKREHRPACLVCTARSPEGDDLCCEVSTPSELRAAHPFFRPLAVNVIYHLLPRLVHALGHRSALACLLDLAHAALILLASFLADDGSINLPLNLGHCTPLLSPPTVPEEQEADAPERKHHSSSDCDDLQWHLSDATGGEKPLRLLARIIETTVVGRLIEGDVMKMESIVLQAMHDCYVGVQTSDWRVLKVPYGAVLALMDEHSRSMEDLSEDQQHNSHRASRRSHCSNNSLRENELCQRLLV